MSSRHVRGVARVLLVLLLAGAARADVIHYKDGRRLEGRIVARTASELTVETDFGTIKVALAKVERIEEKATPREELATRRAALAAGDADGLFELALWARDAGLLAERDALLREVLAARPEHALANELLGRVRVDGRWMDPAEVEAYVASREEEMRAQGLLWNGSAWRPLDEVMQARGFVLWKDEWRPRRAAEAEMVVEQSAELLGVPLAARAGEWLTLYSALPPEEADALAAVLDGLPRALADILRPTEERLNAVAAEEVSLFVLPDGDAYGAFLDSPFADRYGIALEARERYRHRPGFFLDRPRPLVVVLPYGEPEEQAMGLRSVLTNQLVLLTVRRLKHPLPAPGWLQVGLAALLEGQVNRHETITLSGFAVDDVGQPRDPFVAGWESFEQFAFRLHDEGVQQSLPALHTVLQEKVDRLDSRDVAMAWSFLRFVLETRPESLAQYSAAFGEGASELEALDVAQLHDAAWERAFDRPVESVETQWKDWALRQPPLIERGNVFR